MWIELNNTWYNLGNSYKLTMHDNMLTVYFIGENNPTLVRNITKEDIVLIKKYLNGRNN